jgi:hypothetical protein
MFKTYYKTDESTIICMIFGLNKNTIQYIVWRFIFTGTFSTIFGSCSHDQIDHGKTAEILTIPSLRDQIHNGTHSRVTIYPSQEKRTFLTLKP